MRQLEPENFQHRVDEYVHALATYAAAFGRMRDLLINIDAARSSEPIT